MLFHNIHPSMFNFTLKKQRQINNTHIKKSLASPWFRDLMNIDIHRVYRINDTVRLTVPRRH